MGEICRNCKHFSERDTELPVCRLHRKFTHEQWTCGDFSRRIERMDGDRHGKA